ncbi:unnamed protein product, partial [Prunus brigantina]
CLPSPPHLPLSLSRNPLFFFSQPKSLSPNSIWHSLSNPPPPPRISALETAFLNYRSKSNSISSEHGVWRFWVAGVVVGWGCW